MKEEIILYHIEFYNHEKALVIAKSPESCMNKIRHWYHNEIDDYTVPEIISIKKVASTNGEVLDSNTTTKQLII